MGCGASSPASVSFVSSCHEIKKDRFYSFFFIYLFTTLFLLQYYHLQTSNLLLSFSFLYYHLYSSQQVTPDSLPSYVIRNPKLTDQDIDLIKSSWSSIVSGTSAFKGTAKEGSSNIDSIPDDISNVPDDILDKVLISKGNRQFRITEDELSFYKKYQIQLPKESFYDTIKKSENLTGSLFSKLNDDLNFAEKPEDLGKIIEKIQTEMNGLF